MGQARNVNEHISTVNGFLQNIKNVTEAIIGMTTKTECEGIE